MRYLLSAFLCCAALLSGQAPTIDQSLNAKVPGGAVVSPDGSYVAYTVQQPNWEANAFESQIWIGVAATGETYPLTSGKKGASNPQWSPDSKQLAFGSERDGKPQIYVISPRGGEARQLTAGEHGLVSFRWSPDGKQIAFTATAPEPKGHKDRKERLGEFEIVTGDYHMVHLWTVDVPAEIPGDTKALPKPVALTEGDQFSVGSFRWSPDGRQIAFSATRDPDLSSGETSEVYAVRTGDRFLRKLTEGAGPHVNPAWSPDGEQLAFVTAAGQKYSYYQNERIATMPASGGKMTLRSEQFDENPGLLDWNAKGIWFTAAQKTERGLFVLDPATNAAKRLQAPNGLSVGAVSLSADGKTMAFAGSAANQFAEVYVSPLADPAPKRLSDFTAQWKGFRLATREVISWKSKDGTTIEGILIKPADFNASKKYPLLVVIHGGPTGVDTPALTPDRYYPVEQFAAKGAVILRPNYRGSAGYGEKFRSLNVRNLGLGDYEDVISGVDALIAKGIADPERLGAMGWSQGGYISAFITTYSTRFKAVSVGAGISDWMTYYVNTDIHPFTRQYLQKTPWEDPEIYRKTSPITYVNNARTPTLIQHGELDRRVPIPNAYELHQALRDRGVPVKMIVYKGFGHGITKPKEQRAVLEHNYEWFSKWIWNEAPPAAAESGR
jgi:dipeptidyl aminopeptidase/acylaminoacyl peptidase